jgi:hypothetical protein
MALRPSTEYAANEVAILGRVLANGRDIPPALARYVLKSSFNDQDKARMHELAVRNQEGALSSQETAELLSYANAGCLLGILHSKARTSLKRTARK